MKNKLKITALFGVLAITAFGASALPASAHDYDGFRRVRVERQCERADRCERPVVYNSYNPYNTYDNPYNTYNRHPILTSVLWRLGL